MKRQKAGENKSSNRLVHISVQPSFEPGAPQLLSPEEPMSQGEKINQMPELFLPGTQP